VETIAIRSASDATNPAFVAAVQNAEAIFITGGDQANYVRYWAGGGCGCPNVRDAVNQALARGAAVGGTSAGMAVLGQVAYDCLVTLPGGGNLYSSQALADPNQPAVSLSKDFLRTQYPALTGIVTETHVQPNNNDPQGRMGRLVTFLARMAAGSPAVAGTPHGIAASWGTAVLIKTDLTATVVGAPGTGVRRAYFLEAPATAPVLADGTPLSWDGIEVKRVEAGGTFNLASWAGGRRYLLDVINGRLAVEGNNDIY
jgi:cyanophycinase